MAADQQGDSTPARDSLVDRRQIVAGLGSALLTAPACARAARRERLSDQAVAAQLAHAGIPGAALAVVGRHGYRIIVNGWADRDRRVAVSARTLFHVASVSKVVTSAVLMSAVEHQQLALDQPVAPLLDFPLANPAFPGTAITMRHLLMHSSSIADGNYGPQFYGQGDSPLELRQFLVDYLVPGGRHYSPQGSFLPAVPGSQWAYSNVGIALAAYIASRTGPSFEEQCQRGVFAPLAMRDSVWHLRDVGRRPLAVGYTAGRAAPLPPLGYPDWPAGMLRSSGDDMARFVRAFLVEVPRIMSAQSLAEMTGVVVFPGFAATLDGQAIGWRRMPLGHRHLLSHTGSDPGVTSGIYMDRSRQTGAVVLMNITADDNSKAIRAALVEQLLAEAEWFS